MALLLPTANNAAIQSSEYKRTIGDINLSEEIWNCLTCAEITLIFDITIDVLHYTYPFVNDMNTNEHIHHMQVKIPGLQLVLSLHPFKNGVKILDEVIR